MNNWLALGCIRVRIGSRNLAKWGYARIAIGGLDFWSRASNGDLHICAYHPRSSLTWLFYVGVGRHRRFYWTPKSERFSQWHHYFPLPFGRALVVGRQRRMQVKA